MLYRRPRSSYWWAEAQVGGKRYRFSTKRADKKEARAVLEAWLRQQLDAEQLGNLPTLTLQEAIDRSLVRARKVADFRNLESRARKLTEGYGERFHLDGDTPLHLVSRRDIDKLVAARMKEGNAEATIARELSLLSKVVNEARRAGFRVPADFEVPHFKTQQKLRYLSLDEERALLFELWPLRGCAWYRPEKHLTTRAGEAMVDAYDLVVLLLDTGARYSEIAGLTWDQVDTTDWRYLRVWRSKVGNAGTLAMTARMRTVLMWRWQERRDEMFVFPATTRRPRDASASARGHATQAIMKAYDRARINTPAKVKAHGKATVHSLRDTFASRLAQRGFPLQKLAQLLGHSNVATTQKYAHLGETQSADEAL